MRIHYLQHEYFEGLGSMESYLKENHQLTCTHLYLDEELPSLNEFEWLIIMGGPMNIHDEKNFPWLKKEKIFISKAINDGKKILGICLGAQLIAHVLEARVEKSKQREIGWFPVSLSNEAKETEWGKILPENPVVFHWHADTFQIPESAVRLYTSKACENQGFAVGENIIAFQFHPEAVPSFAEELIKNCKDEMDGSRYVQMNQKQLTEKSKFDTGNKLILQVLKKLEE